MDLPIHVSSALEAPYDPDEAELTCSWLTRNASLRPDAIAHEIYSSVNSVPEMLTYASLNGQSNRLARWLVSRGLRREDKIAVCRARDKYFYIAHAGIFKVGGCYVSIDPELPEERKKYIADDSGSKFVLTSADQAPYFGELAIVLDDLAVQEEVLGHDAADICLAELDSLAYLLYTSGTTGTPKGCLLNHRGLYWAIIAMCKLPSKVTNPDTDKRLALASIAFDVHISEICQSWCLGIRLVSGPRYEFLANLQENIINIGITHLGMVPSMIEATLSSPDDLPLKYLVSGGEKISDGVRCLFDVYSKLTFIDVASSQMGYIAEINFGEFLWAYGSDNWLCYRTGDLVRLMPDNTLEIMGRIDTQIKLRGVRIESEGVSNVLLTATPIPTDATTLVSLHPGLGSAEVLVSFVAVLNANITFFQRRSELPVVTDEAFSNSDTLQKMRDAAIRELAVYMRPSYIIPLNFLPLNMNGKTDNKILSALFKETQLQDLIRLQGQAFAQITSDLTSEEAQVIEVVSRVTGLEPGHINQFSNLFESGLDSLKFPALASELRKTFMTSVTVAELMRNPVIRDVARLIPRNDPDYPSGDQTNIVTEFAEKWKSVADGIFEPSSIQAVLPPFPVQEGILFRCIASPHLYVQHFMYRCRKSVDLSKMKRSWEAVMRRQEILRTCFIFDGTLLQVVLHDGVNPLPWQFSDYEDKESSSFRDWFLRDQASHVSTRINEDFTTPLFAIGIYRNSSDKEVYMVNLCLDGIIMQFLEYYVLDVRLQLMVLNQQSVHWSLFVTESIQHEQVALGQIQRWLGVSELVDVLFSCRFDTGEQVSDVIEHIGTSRSSPEFIFAVEFVLQPTDDAIEVRVSFTEPEITPAGVLSLFARLEQVLENVLSHNNDIACDSIINQSSVDNVQNANLIDESSSSVELELILQKYISEFLGIELPALRPTTSFTSLGLSSIKAVSLSRVLLQHGINVSPVDIIQGDQIRAIAKRAHASASFDDALETTEWLNDMKERLANELNVERLKLEPEDAIVITGCTSLQTGMLAQTINSRGLLYIHAFTLQLAFDCDVSRLQAAWHEAVQNLTILRTSFHFTPISGQWAQVTHSIIDFKWSHSTQDKLGSAAADFITTLAFDNEETFARPPVYFRHVSADMEYLVVVLHHALYDGLSLPKLFHHVQQLYQSKPVDLSTPFNQVADTILVAEGNGTAFWTRRLESVKPCHFMVQSRSSEEAWRASTTLEITTAEIQRFCRRYHVHPQALGQATWAKILCMREIRSDIIFGQVVSGRSLSGADNVIGPVFNTIPCRVSLIKGQSNQQLVRDIHRSNNDGLPWQHASLRSIQRQLNLGSLFDTLFLYQPHVALTHENPLWHLITRQDMQEGKTQYAVNIELHEGEALYRHSSIYFSLRYMPPTSLKASGDPEAAIKIWSPTQQQLWKILIDFTGLPSDAIRPSTLLIAIGIDSICAIQVASLARRAGIPLTATDVARSPTVQDLLFLDPVTNKGVVTQSKPIPLELSPELVQNIFARLPIGYQRKISRLLPLAAGMEWTLSAWQMNRAVFPFKLDRNDEAIDVVSSRLHNAWQKLIRRHEILRSVLIHTEEQNYRVLLGILSMEEFEVPWEEDRLPSHDLLSNKTELELVRMKTKELAVMPISFGQPPTQLVLLHGKQSSYIIIGLHHMQYDGWRRSSAAIPNLDVLAAPCCNYAPVHVTLGIQPAGALKISAMTILDVARRIQANLANRTPVVEQTRVADISKWIGLKGKPFCNVAVNVLRLPGGELLKGAETPERLLKAIKFPYSSIPLQMFPGDPFFPEIQHDCLVEIYFGTRSTSHTQSSSSVLGLSIECHADLLSVEQAGKVVEDWKDLTHPSILQVKFRVALFQYGRLISNSSPHMWHTASRKDTDSPPSKQHVAESVATVSPFTDSNSNLLTADALLD
ncbi:peptide synthetase [Lentinula edodes]|uniref:Peptide synthetase n=1 Tax=Lentinula edodes TaxID=5353 RepID=A0A1Q3E2F0_LENED|nr:peptide synthetase [Lentinula edodes]